jgi:Zn-dependent protease with chaperone function
VILAVSFVLAATAVFGVLAPAISRRARPGLALGVLAVGGLALTTFCLLALGAVGATAAGRIPVVARLGDWSSVAIDERTPVPPWVAVSATVVVLFACFGAVRALITSGWRLLRAWSAANDTTDALVVLDDERPMAYALPGWPGRIVTTSGLLRRLDASGRRALLAHERAHLRGRHDLVLAVGAVVAGANPLLRLLPAALSLACERRADEVAARTVGDRHAVVRAITLAVRPALAAELLLPAGGEVIVRVDSLLRERRRGRTWAVLQLLLPALAVAAGALALLAVAQDLDQLLDAAALLRR